ncbi:hypothetical protein ACFV4K_27975 [Nocardia sp. NPDC059764]|uniref:hypothetical protein n=1 Tax=Nocardia sp. NPDC059764 TaxID=3346939 RepID=UPI00365C6314
MTAPIMPVRPNPHQMDKFDDQPNGAGAQPNPSQPTIEQPRPSPQPATGGQTPNASGQPTPADPATPKKFSPGIAPFFPTLINPDGTVRTAEQGYVVDTPPTPLPLGPLDVINWPAPGETKTLPSGLTVIPGSPTTYPGAIDVNGTTYPGEITATTTVLVLPGRAEPIPVVDTRITVNQPHPFLGGTSWTAKLDDNQQATQIDIANPTMGIAGIAMSDTGLRIKRTTGTTMTVNAQGQPDGPFENPSTGERGVAEPLPGGGYRAKFDNGAITEYNANGDVVNHLPAPRADSGDGFWSKGNDARLTAGGWITDGLAAALGAVQQKAAQGVAGLTSATSGGSLTPVGRAYLPAANGESLEDPSKTWKAWFDKLSINGTARSLGHVVTGLFAMTDLGEPANSVGEALGYHPNLPTIDTIGQAMGDNVKAAQKEFDKGNTVGGLNYLGMATGLLPDFRDPNSVLVWAVLARLGKNSVKGSPGVPEMPLPAPIKPLPKLPATLGSGIVNPAAATPAFPIKMVLDRQPSLEKFELAQSVAQQGLDVQQLQLRMAEIRTTEKAKSVTFEAEVTAMMAVDGVPARVGSQLGSEVVNRVPQNSGGLPQNPSVRNTDAGNAGGSDGLGGPASGSSGRNPAFEVSGPGKPVRYGSKPSKGHPPDEPILAPDGEGGLINKKGEIEYNRAYEEYLNLDTHAGTSVFLPDPTTPYGSRKIDAYIQEIHSGVDFKGYWEVKLDPRTGRPNKFVLKFMIPKDAKGIRAKFELFQELFGKDYPFVVVTDKVDVARGFANMFSEEISNGEFYILDSQEYLSVLERHGVMHPRRNVTFNEFLINKGFPPL